MVKRSIIIITFSAYMHAPVSRINDYETTGTLNPRFVHTTKYNSCCVGIGTSVQLDLQFSYNHRPYTLISLNLGHV